MAELEAEDATERALASAARASRFLGAASRLPPKVTVTVRPAPRGRATGWSLDCPDHGPMPVLAPGRRAALEAAREHLELDHGNRGTIDAVNSSAGTKPRRKGKRRRG